MDDLQFRELLAAVHNERGDIWEIRQKRIEKILRDLLEGEFRDAIQERSFLINITKLKPGINAHIYRWAKPVWIELNSERWEKQPGLCDHDIKETLRHELLHIALNAGDEDPVFKLEAKRREIKLNLPGL